MDPVGAAIDVGIEPSSLDVCSLDTYKDPVAKGQESKRGHGVIQCRPGLRIGRSECPAGSGEVYAVTVGERIHGSRKELAGGDRGRLGITKKGKEEQSGSVKASHDAVIRGVMEWESTRLIMQ